MRPNFCIYCITTLLLNCTGANLPSAIASCNLEPIFEDWILDPNPKSTCQGYYHPRIPMALDYQSDDTDLPLTITFDQSETRMEGLSVFNNAYVEQGQRIIQADTVTLIRQEGEIESIQASQNVELHQPNLSAWADNAFYNVNQQYLRLECNQIRWYPKHARLQSEQAELFKDQHIELDHAQFTTCPPHLRTWTLKTKHISLLPDQGRAKARNITLNWQDVPIFYWPYLDYPIDNKRHSGFLFPSYGSSSQSGIEITVPYYFNLAPNYDLLLGLTGYSKRGVGITSNFRYLSHHFSGEFNLEYLPDDNAYQKFRENIQNNPPLGYRPGDPRLQGIGHHDYRLGIGFDHRAWYNHWQFDFSYHRVSDDNYYVDLGNDIHTISTLHLPQRAQAFYSGQNWFHTFRVEEYQVLQPYNGDIIHEIYRRQPQWIFEAEYPSVMGNLDLKLDGEVVNFTHPGDPINQVSLIEGQRWFIQPQLSLPLRRSWGEFIPSFYANWLGYDLKLPHNTQFLDEQPNRFAPIYTVDGKLFFEKELSFCQKQWRQTLIPRAYYVNIPYRDQSLYPNFDSGVINFSYAQLYRYNRFSGLDRLNEANQLSLSINSQLLDQTHSFEWFRIGVGEIFYFTDQKVLLCEASSPNSQCTFTDPPRLSRKHSNLLSEMVFSSPNLLQTGFFIEWGLKEKLIEQASWFLHYPICDNFIFNANYYFTRRDIKNFSLSDSNLNFSKLNQGDISALIPIHHRMNLLAKLHYDFEFNQYVELLGGIEYDSCCFASQLIFSRYRKLGNALLGREYANQLMLQFVFKGLSSVGLNQPDAKLALKIPGYTPLKERFILPKVR